MPIRLRLIGKRSSHSGSYARPVASEIARLIVGDIDMYNKNWDIVVEHKDRKLKHISILHPSLMSMQYPILFPYGKDGYQIDIEYVNPDFVKSKKRRFVTMHEYYGYRLQ